MARPRMPGLLSFLLALRFVMSCQAAVDDLSQNQQQELRGGGIASIIALRSNLGERGAAAAVKEGESGKASGKAGASSILMPTSDHHKSSSPPSSSSSLSSMSSSSSTSALDARASLHNESKETMSCPASCFRPNPVCGVDGVTYWCGSADAECAGVEVEYMGFCDFGSKGTGGKGVLAVQSLLLVHMIWLMLAAFLVLLGVP